MLPHDELLHYGVRGMRWGVRSSKLRSAMIDRSSNKIEKFRIKQESQVNDQHMKDTHARLKADLANRKIDKNTYKFESQKEIFRYARKAEELSLRKQNVGKPQTPPKKEYQPQKPDRNSDGYQKQYQRFDKAASKTYDKPFNSYDQKRGQNVFKRAAGKLAIDVATSLATGAAVRAVGPTADAFGSSIAKYTVGKSKHLTIDDLPKNIRDSMYVNFPKAPPKKK